MLVAGAILLIVGMNASNSVLNQLRNLFTGHLADTTVWYYAGSMASALTGLLLVLTGGGKATV